MSPTTDDRDRHNELKRKLEYNRKKTVEAIIVILGVILLVSICVIFFIQATP